MFMRITIRSQTYRTIISEGVKTFSDRKYGRKNMNIFVILFVNLYAINHIYSVSHIPYLAKN